MIRKYILSLFIFLLLPFALSAQHFSGGMSVGFTRSDITGMNGTINLRHMTSTGFTGGLLADYSLDENNFLQMEINYTQKGCKTPPNDLYDYYLFKLNYFDVPLLYRYALEASNYNLMLVFDGGISVGTLYSTSLVQSIYGVGILPVSNPALKFRQIDVCMLGGFGFCFPNGLYAGQRVAYGSFPCFKRERLPAGLRMYGIGKGHNVDTQIFLQYSFGKAKMRVKGW